MAILQQILFIGVFAFAVWQFSLRMGRIKRNILLGQPEDLSDQPGRRWKNVVRLALGQKKMFRNPLVAVLHLVIYLGFLIVNIEMLEIVFDGVTSSHRIFSNTSTVFYRLLINIFEFLAVSVILVCVVFLARRNMLSIRRFRSADLKGWAFKDANIILVAEIVLMTLFLTMDAADTLLQSREVGDYAQHPTGDFYFSSWMHPLIGHLSDTNLILLERTCWWLHIIGVLAFLNYLPWSKHLHIILAFPNAYFARFTPTGKISNMPDVQREVVYAFQPETAPAADQGEAGVKKFGARDIQDLSWKQILDAYSCTECGRCSTACPANQTGKLLSPRKIMMSTRDRAEEIGRNIDLNGSFQDDGKALLGDYITEEELRACTTCNACVEECPVSINPLDIILQMRRYLVMEKSSAPQEWTMMFGNVENNFAPWKFSPEQRTEWINN